MTTIISRISSNSHVLIGLISILAVILTWSLLSIRMGIKKTIQKNGFSLLSSNEKRNYKLILDDYMKTQKPYLNANISLSDVAREMSVSENHIENIISKSFKNTFYNYVNKFRVDEGITAILNSTSQEINVNELMVKTGFATYDAFHDNFTHRVGMTPDAFQHKISRISVN